MKKSFVITLLLLVGATTSLHAENNTESPSPLVSGEPTRNLLNEGTVLPYGVAALDSVTTFGVINGGVGVEVNSIVNTSAAGLLGLFAVKAGIVYYANTLEPVKRKTLLKQVAGLWGGVSANNLLLIAGATGPQAIVFGIAAGFGFYHWESQILEREQSSPLANPLIQNISQDIPKSKIEVN